MKISKSAKGAAKQAPTKASNNLSNAKGFMIKAAQALSNEINIQGSEDLKSVLNDLAVVIMSTDTLMR